MFVRYTKDQIAYPKATQARMQARASPIVENIFPMARRPDPTEQLTKVKLMRIESFQDTGGLGLRGGDFPL